MKAPLPEIRVKKPLQAPRRLKKAKNKLPEILAMSAQTDIRAGQKLRLKSEWVNVKTFIMTHTSPKQADRLLRNTKVNKVPDNFFGVFRDCPIDERYCDDDIPEDLHIGVRKIKNCFFVTQQDRFYPEGIHVLIKKMANMKHSCEPNLEFLPFQPGYKHGYWEFYATRDIKRGTRLTLDMIPESYGQNRKATLKSFAQECHNPQCPHCKEECEEESVLEAKINDMVPSFSEALPLSQNMKED